MSDAKTYAKIEVANTIFVTRNSSKTAVGSRRESENCSGIDTCNDLNCKTIQYGNLNTVCPASRISSSSNYAADCIFGISFVDIIVNALDDDTASSTNSSSRRPLYFG